MTYDQILTNPAALNELADGLDRTAQRLENETPLTTLDLNGLRQIGHLLRHQADTIQQIHNLITNLLPGKNHP